MDSFLTDPPQLKMKMETSYWLLDYLYLVAPPMLLISEAKIKALKMDKKELCALRAILLYNDGKNPDIRDNIYISIYII